MGCTGSQSVSPVLVSASLVSTPMSPAMSLKEGVSFLPHMVETEPALAVFSMLALVNCVLGVSTPEMILMREILPTKGSARVLKTCAEKGSSTEQTRSAGSFVLGLVPRLGNAFSTGEGMRVTMKFSRLEMPSAGSAAPQNTGVIVAAAMPLRRPRNFSSSVSSPVSKYFSISSSSAEAAASVTSSQTSSIFSCISGVVSISLENLSR